MDQKEPIPVSSTQEIRFNYLNRIHGAFDTDKYKLLAYKDGSRHYGSDWQFSRVLKEAWDKFHG